MRSHVIMSVAIIFSLIALSIPVWGNDPIKWSAPMSHYPNQWAPTPEPPRYYNPYGYRNPYYGYGYGYGYGGYDYYGYGTPRYAGYGQANQSRPHQSFSGNPYSYYYGR